MIWMFMGVEWVISYLWQAFLGKFFDVSACQKPCTIRLYFATWKRDIVFFCPDEVYDNSDVFDLKKVCQKLTNFIVLLLLNRNFLLQLTRITYYNNNWLTIILASSIQTKMSKRFIQSLSKWKCSK